jgi:hypothetical protein
MPVQTRATTPARRFRAAQAHGLLLIPSATASTNQPLEFTIGHLPTKWVSRRLAFSFVYGAFSRISVVNSGLRAIAALPQKTGHKNWLYIKNLAIR